MRIAQKIALKIALKAIFDKLHASIAPAVLLTLLSQTDKASKVSLIEKRSRFLG